MLTAHATALEEEVVRLVGLGATDAVTDSSGATTLRDPDGVAFVMRAD